MVDVFANDLVLDGALDIIKNNAVRIHACAMGVDAVNYANVVANELGVATISSTDFVHGDRLGSGRKTTFGGKAITIDTAGTVDSYVFTDGSAIVYKIALPTSNIGVGAATVLTVNAFDILGLPDVVAV